MQLYTAYTILHILVVGIQTCYFICPRARRHNIRKRDPTVADAFP